MQPTQFILFTAFFWACASGGFRALHDEGRINDLFQLHAVICFVVGVVAYFCGRHSH